MRFNRFARFGGGFRFSSRRPPARKIYDALVKAAGGVYDLTEGSLIESRFYAWAMMLARAQLQLDRAEAQADPMRAWDLFTLLEARYGLTPWPDQPMADRRAELALRMLIPQGPTEGNIVAGLKRIVGTTNFITYRTVLKTEVVSWPSDPGGFSAPGHFPPLNAKRKLVKLTTSAHTLNVPLEVEFEHVLGDPNPFQVGETVVFEPGRLGQHEKVTIEAATATSLTATFSKAHGKGQYATTSPYPFHWSSQKHSLVVVAASVVEDVDLRRRINTFMRRIMRGTSTWSIVKPTGANALGPFKHGEPSIGITTLGAMTF